MASYETIAKDLWDFSSTYCCREEDIWDQLFLTIGGGYEWHNGELSKHSIKKEKKTKPVSIADDAKKMVKDSSDKDPSYWFDHYYIEYFARKNSPKYFRNPYISDNDDYCNINNIPDNITKEWASVILSTCLWIDTYELDEYIKIHLNDRIKMYFGCGDEQEKRIYNEHPEWKTIRDTHYAKTKKMGFMKAILYKDEEFNKVHASVMEIMIKENTPKAKADLKHNFKNLKKVAESARKRLNEIGLGDIEPYKVPIREKNISIPKWYKPNSKREKTECFFWTINENELDKINDSFTCYGVWMTTRELMTFLPKEANG